MLECNQISKTYNYTCHNLFCNILKTNYYNALMYALQDCFLQD